jgi:hypothetical protein
MGKLRSLCAVFTFAGESAGEVIRVCKLRKGDEVRKGVIVGAALGTSVTLILGDDDGGGADPDRYVEATAHASAAATVFPAAAVITKVPYTVTADCWLTLTTAGGAANGKVMVIADILRAGA